MNKIIADDIKKLLINKYSSSKNQYLYFNELRTGTGGWRINIIDFWVMDCYSSNNYKKTAYEIKVNKNDFLKEIKNSKKRRRALLFSNEFYFIMLKDLIDHNLVPLNCGLIEVDYNKNNILYQRIVIDAPWHESARPNWPFIAAILRKEKTNDRTT